MKQTVLPVGIALTCFLCACTQPTPPTNAAAAPIASPYDQEPIDHTYDATMDIYRTIQQALGSGTTLVHTTEDPGLLPPYIFKAQLNWKAGSGASVAEMWNLGSVQFLPVYHNAMNAPVSFSGNYGYSGILARIRGTQLWYDFFRAPVEYRASKDTDGKEELFLTNDNVIGAFIKDAKLYIDVADDNGAGSGEGTMTRFAFQDGEWSYGGCFYFNGNFSGPNSYGLPYDPFGQEKLPRQECLL